MGFLVPKEFTLATLQNILSAELTLRLYGNNKTPAPGDTASAYTEVTGGGYVSKPLTSGAWSYDTTGTTPIATYEATQIWTFTGPVGGPGNIYGYYVTRNSDGKLMLAERFSALLVPFVPIAGSSARVLPKYSVASQF